MIDLNINANTIKIPEENISKQKFLKQFTESTKKEKSWPVGLD